MQVEILIKLWNNVRGMIFQGMAGMMEGVLKKTSQSSKNKKALIHWALRTGARISDARYLTEEGARRRSGPSDRGGERVDHRAARRRHALRRVRSDGGPD